MKTSPTHQEMLLMTEKERNVIREQQLIEMTQDIEHLFSIGKKRIYLSYGVILVKKNKNGIFYTMRSGKGTGCNLCEYLNLIDVVRECRDSGWGTVTHCE